tara:strand:- start:179 stop:592 length:414 start_codon:yes stop_codon:yes gene_type:complete
MKSLQQLLAPKKETNEINIGPLIDMVFILLIFFMVTTTFNRDNQLDIQRPSAQSGQLTDQQVLRVAVSSRGETTVDGKPVNQWMLQARIREALAIRLSKSVLLVADQHVETGDLIRIMDECTLAGASGVGVAVEQAQ